MVRYIERDANWHDHLIQDKQGKERLLTWLATRRSLNAKREFDNWIIKTYQNDGQIYLREAIKRYFFPNSPIVIAERQFDFFVGDLSKTIEGFFAYLDSIFKKTPLDKLSFYLFQFELTLHQLNRNTSQQNQAIIEETFQRIANEFGLNKMSSTHPFETQIAHTIKRGINNQFLGTRTWLKTGEPFLSLQSKTGISIWKTIFLKLQSEVGAFFIVILTNFTMIIFWQKKMLFCLKTSWQI